MQQQLQQPTFSWIQLPSIFKTDFQFNTQVRRRSTEIPSLRKSICKFYRQTKTIKQEVKSIMDYLSRSCIHVFISLIRKAMSKSKRLFQPPSLSVHTIISRSSIKLQNQEMFLNKTDRYASRVTKMYSDPYTWRASYGSYSKNGFDFASVSFFLPPLTFTAS